MLNHAGKCKWKHENVLDFITDCKDFGEDICARKYKVRWKGCGPEEDTWEPRTNFHPKTIYDFEVANDYYDYD